MFYCCGDKPIRSIGPVTSYDFCPCKCDPPFSNLGHGPVYQRPTCWCEDWSTPCVSYQSSSNYHYLPSPTSGPRSKRLYFCHEPMIPGYSGHIPAYKYHSAGRTFGNATRDTCCAVLQRHEPCRPLPDRVWEQ